MINNCKYLTGSYCRAKLMTCPYMADPSSCELYEELFTKPYKTPSGREKEVKGEEADTV